MIKLLNYVLYEPFCQFQRSSGMVGGRILLVFLKECGSKL